MRTERLTLRFVGEDDVETLTAYRNDPAVAELQDWELPYPRERAHALVDAHRGLTDFEAGRGHQVGIELEGRLVGDVYVGLDEHGAIADIGFSLTPSAQGRGIAYEAVSALVADLVQRRRVHRVVAELSKENLASMRLLERLGLEFESLSVRSFWWRGRWDDNVHYAMTDEQWRAWRDRPRGPATSVNLVEITDQNRRPYARLRVHRSQRQLVAGVQDSYADAYFGGTRHGAELLPVLRGIEADGEPAGFLMYAVPGPYLWRFLIDRRHQGRGIGRRALTQWIDAMRAEGHSEIETSWVPVRGGPEPFYSSLGFVPTGELDEGEVVARLPITVATGDGQTIGV